MRQKVFVCQGWVADSGLVLAVAAVATAAGRQAPLIGAPVAGIVIGVVLAAVLRPGQATRARMGRVSRYTLQAAVVMFGFQLSLAQIVRVGLGSLPVMAGTLAACLLAAYGLGRRLGIARDLRTLIGAGTGICGASAIAAVTPVIEAAGTDVAYAVSTIFLFNIAAVLTFPVLGHLLGMSQHAFGLFAGTAVNDMSSVVAAATSYGSGAANYAVVVKLTRTLTIIPLCLGLAALTTRRRNRDVIPTTTAPNDPGRQASSRPRVRVARLVPLFLVGFLMTAAANSAGLVPPASRHGLTVVSVFLITVALSAIGLSTDLTGLRRTGYRPLLLGACLWLTVSATSIALQALVSSL